MNKLKSVLSVTLATIFALVFNLTAFAVDAVLPATGGIGTTIFYVGGVALVIGAVIFFVIRRKSAGNSYDEEDEDDEAEE